MATKKLVAHNNGTTFKVIHAKKLFVDWGYQRVTRGSSRSKRIMGKFDWSAVHTFLVSPRGRRFACVDGGTRLDAIEQKFPGLLDEKGNDILLHCEVLKRSKTVGGNFVQEAEGFLGAQDEQRAPNANDAFKARLYAKQRPAVRTFNIAKQAGIQIVFRQPGKRFRTERNETRLGGVFYWAYTYLGEAEYKFFCQALTEFVREDSSGDIESKTLQAAFLRGMAEFVKSNIMSHKDVIKGIKPIGLSAGDIVDNAQRKTMNGFQRSKAISHEIELVILKGLTNYHDPEGWWERGHAELALTT